MSNSAIVKVLAVVAIATRATLRERLSPLDVGLKCVSTAEEIEALRHQGESFEVVLLPEKLGTSDWWVLWGELSRLDTLPSIVVYARSPNLRLWTAVLDLGGYGVISDSFDSVEIRRVISEATQDYRKRLMDEMSG